MPHDYVRLIKGIARAAGMDSDEGIKVRPVQGGCVNEIYSLQTSAGVLVVKIYVDAKIGHVWRRYLRESKALEKAAVHDGIPAPKLIYRDHSCREIPFPFVIMEHVGGESLRERVMMGDRRSSFASLLEALKILKRIHGVRLAGYPLEDRQDSWGKLLGELDQSLFGFLGEVEVRKNARLQRHVKKVRELFLDWKCLLPHRDYCWTHGDFTLNNLLVDRQLQITGIVDWELSQVGVIWMDLGAFVRHYLLLPRALPRSEQELTTLLDHYGWDGDVLSLAFFIACRDIFEVGYLVRNNMAATLKCLTRAERLLAEKQQCSLHRILKLYSF